MGGTIALNAVELLAQSNWVWKANMPTARFGPCACVVDGKIYAVSGALVPGVVTNRVERYDPATGTWTTNSTGVR